MRLTILGLVILTGVAAAFLMVSADRRAGRLEQERQFKETTVERLLASASTLAGARRLPGEAAGVVGTITPASTLLDRMATDAAGLRAAQGAEAASNALETFWTALSALMSADRLAAASSGAGDETAAGDLLLSTAAIQAGALESSLVAFRDAERRHHEASYARVRGESRAALAAAAALWGISLIAFALVGPGTRSAPGRDTAAAPPAQSPAVEAAHASPAGESVDLPAIAALAADVAQLDDAAQVPGLLGRLCGVVDAQGAVLWMRKGEALHAVAAAGYDPAILQRLAPLTVDDDNPTAAAWRSGELTVVPAAAEGRGAVVAPLRGPNAVAGALALEMAAGRERDPATCAVILILAAQLTGVLAPASPEAPELHRQTAAS